MYNKLSSLLKYLVLFIVLYIILCVSPNLGRNKIELFVVTFIIILIYILFENICSLFNNDNFSNITNSMCTAVCSNRENMVNNLSEKLNYNDSEDNDNESVEKMNKNTSIKVRKNTYKESNESNLEKGIEHGETRATDGVMEDESEFDQQDYNHLPLGEQINTGSFEYGYSFLPPEKWFPTPPVPPICVAEKRCPINPINTTGVPVNIKEWNSTRRITQPDVINTKYIKKKLNAGR